MLALGWAIALAPEPCHDRVRVVAVLPGVAGDSGVRALRAGASVLLGATP